MLETKAFAAMNNEASLMPWTLGRRDVSHHDRAYPLNDNEAEAMVNAAFHGMAAKTVALNKRIGQGVVKR
jgi:hypothetical protein